MRHIWLIVLVLLLVGTISFILFTDKTHAPMVPVVSTPSPSTETPPLTPTGKDDLIVLDSPRPGATITSPLTITGKARGNWYFEASFPLVLVDWDGKIIAEGHAEAQGDWMTTDFVPFKGTLTFVAPVSPASKRGTLILRKDNPSGEPIHDDSLEVEIQYQ